MRVMKCSPENRKAVFLAIRSAFNESHAGLSIETISMRSRLDEITCESCCDAMLRSGALVKTENGEHVTYQPAPVGRDTVRCG